jgi:hypothetical protein
MSRLSRVPSLAQFWGASGVFVRATICAPSRSMAQMSSSCFEHAAEEDVLAIEREPRLVTTDPSAARQYDGVAVSAGVHDLDRLGTGRAARCVEHDPRLRGDQAGYSAARPDAVSWGPVPPALLTIRRPIRMTAFACSGPEQPRERAPTGFLAE